MTPPELTTVYCAVQPGTPSVFVSAHVPNNKKGSAFPLKTVTLCPEGEINSIIKSPAYECSKSKVKVG